MNLVQIVAGKEVVSACVAPAPEESKWSHKCLCCSKMPWHSQNILIWDEPSSPHRVVVLGMLQGRIGGASACLSLLPHIYRPRACCNCTCNKGPHKVSKHLITFNNISVTFKLISYLGCFCMLYCSCIILHPAIHDIAPGVLGRLSCLTCMPIVRAKRSW